MAFLIDSDIIIYSTKGNKVVQDRFTENKQVPKSISVITYGELLYGARRSDHVEKNLAVVHRIKELFPILDVDKAVIETFSILRSEARRSGDNLDDMDLLIASTALTNNLTLVSNNIRHFSKIKGLRLENWSV